MDAFHSHLSILQSQLQSQFTQIYASLPEPLQLYFTRQNLQILLRVIIIISSYILFRPHLESLFRKVTGTPDPRQAEIEARLQLLRQQREDATNASIGTNTGTSAKPRTMEVVGKAGRVVKLVVPGEKEEQENQSRSRSQSQSVKKKGGKKKK
ncbi:uncharacterized protein Z518_10944 [Rhinocladiella mackenziei CBS 650.93]|uniref:Uncharacterized protein n=1 Tax=Rhinocladiella mackenziei CBS 650.93 TaxID=1442369 RepID=A0A0D2FD83_9EURO|nr:uncharacterized protein Z518_10944 [Rhinocladiella mackenziei CBS 650.93]KIX00017.1 hypothetical protein Z518_10944 [Rhinocladiella mackenziei CBS 650.93]